MAKKIIDKKLILRAILKLLSGTAVLWLVYVFTAGFFTHSDSPNTASQTYSLANLKNNQSVYFSFNQRDLLVIKTSDKHHVFWADDPVYGCRLEYFKNFIKPICIDIKYNLAGYNSKKNQQLLTPEFEINTEDELIIY